MFFNITVFRCIKIGLKNVFYLLFITLYANILTLVFFLDNLKACCKFAAVLILNINDTMKKIIVASLIAAVGLAVGVSVQAAPAEKVDAFVCPVLNETVGEHNPNAFPIFDGDYSLIPGGGDPHVISVPNRATNGNGAGSLGGPHAQPGDADYSAIWSLE